MASEPSPVTSSAAYRLLRAPNPGAVVFASPHSGRIYPPELLARTRLPAQALRRGEDRFVDRLLGGVAAMGVPCVLGEIARAWIDLNRDPAELDPALFGAVPPDARASPRVAAGLGVIPRAFAPDGPIYEGQLELDEAPRRIAAVHAPYHSALAALLAEARARHGYAVLIDCHSMPSLGGARVVVGDLKGKSATAAVSSAVAAGLNAIGLSVALNDPYAGAYTLERHGRPEAGVHAVQIEIDRALYLDSDRQTLLPGATHLAANMGRFAADLASRVARLGLAQEWAIAAE